MDGYVWISLLGLGLFTGAVTWLAVSAGLFLLRRETEKLRLQAEAMDQE